MKHGSKQTMAWAISLAISGSLFGGGIIIAKKLSAKRPSQSSPDSHETGSDDHDDQADEHHDEEKPQHGAKPEHHDEEKPQHGAKPEHHDEKKPQHEKPQHGAKPEEHSSNDEKPKDIEWSYKRNDQANGPAKWGSLDPSFATCEKGREQSPVDLRNAVTKASAQPITWQYGATEVTLENNGRFVIGTFPHDHNKITLSGATYHLESIAFKSPSEHRINGIPSEIEIQLLHKGEKGKALIVSLFAYEKQGPENQVLAPLFKSLPHKAGEAASSVPTIELASILPKHRDYFTYKGSLSTPPCSEGVQWIVLKEPITINGPQFDLYSGLFQTPGNRPVQNLYGREIIQSDAPAAVAH